MLSASLRKTIGNPCGACTFRVAELPSPDEVTVQRTSDIIGIVPQDASVALALHLGDSLAGTTVTNVVVDLRDGAGKSVRKIHVAGELMVGVQQGPITLVKAGDNLDVASIDSFRMSWMYKGAQGTAAFFADSSVHVLEASTHRQVA